MKTLLSVCAAGVLLLAGCDASVDQKLVSATPASPQQFAAARNAAAVCAQHAPNWQAIEATLRSRGYVDPTDAGLRSALERQDAKVLQTPDANLLVLLGSRPDQGACIVGLKGMTPQQSFALALPWVKQHGAETNEARGQGLADNAVQAWRATNEDQIIYIAAYKTWEVLRAPGAAARLLFVRK